MKKHLPNILLLTVILTNIFFMGSYIKNNGIGQFLSTTGIVFLILGVVIFIYFLSIDPGYGWTSSIDLSRNYIMIFTSLAVSITGIVLIVTGQQINDLHVQKMNKKIRCEELIAGNAAEVLHKDWYSLRDQKSIKPLKVYLFQKKSDRNNYKIIAARSDQSPIQVISNLIISSDSIQETITVKENSSVCPGIFEEDISIDFDTHQKLNERIQFDIAVTISEGSLKKSVSSMREETVKFTLNTKAFEDKNVSEPRTQVSTQAADETDYRGSENATLGEVITLHVVNEAIINTK